MVQMNRGSDRDQNVDQTAFLENDVTAGKGLFVGTVPKRFVKSLYGAAHGIASLLSLGLGNWIFARKILLGGEVDRAIMTAFLIITVFSACVTIFFFWNKVQSWQLSTTTMKEKGVAAQQVQNLNRGRGTVSFLAQSLFPLVVAFCPPEWLGDSSFSRVVALVVLVLGATIYYLIKGFGKNPIFIYGGNHVQLALSILYHGSIAKLIEAHPHMLELLENEAVFVIMATQFGFMWYYFYSRRLVSKELVQKMCNRYHPFVTSVWLYRAQRDAWWSSLPKVMWPRFALMTFFFAIFVLKILFAKLKKGGAKKSSQP